MTTLRVMTWARAHDDEMMLTAFCHSVIEAQRSHFVIKERN
jgi:hypothetical protein